MNANADVHSENDNDNENAFDTLSNLAMTLLYQSDMKRDAKAKGSSTSTDGGGSGGSTGSGSSATNWIDDQSSFVLQQALDRIAIKLPDERIGLDRDEALSWLWWMKTSPTPLIIDLTNDLIDASKAMSESMSGSNLGDAILSDELLARIDTNEKDFLSRIGCKLYLFPSGSELKSPLVEPTGIMEMARMIYLLVVWPCLLLERVEMMHLRMIFKVL